LVKKNTAKILVAIFSPLLQNKIKIEFFLIKMENRKEMKELTYYTFKN